ncbi:MAG: ComF family protein [Betaproteobacteria bacterium]|nr:MAG: ComF family protein [Betaproteobacteria bacterium]
MREFLSNLLFGGSCFLCRGAARGILCPACDADLPRLAGTLCPRCALPSPGSALCGRCLADAPHYDATVAALAYRFPADTLVHALKFRSQLALAPLMGDLLIEAIRERIDLVVPVPLSRERLRERGYNQAAEIARHVARERRARLELTVVVRERNTRAQADLPWSDRARNVRGAFRCERSLDGAAIAVVDDVMTTGATLDELAATLKRAGAVRVVNWVVARTFPPDA